MTQSRAGKAELIKRREEIQQLILLGVTSHEIVDTMSVKWKTTKRAVQEDLRIIAKEWADKAPEETQLLRNKYADRLEYLFNEAMSRGQVKIALEVQKEIHKLNAVYHQNEEAKEEGPKFIQIGRRTPLKAVAGTDE